MTETQIHPDNTAWSNTFPRQTSTVQQLIDHLTAMAGYAIGIGEANAEACEAAADLLQMMVDVEAGGPGSDDMPVWEARGLDEDEVFA